jgi:SAM-dependent methyltransferase
MSQYALGRSGAEEVERARLAMLAELHDPFTERQLEAIGVGEGWRCLDAGAGAGAVTRLLAARVGPAGSVLATDLDTRLLEEVAGGTVEVRRHDLLADPLPEASFDLVHARCLLMHVPARLEALRRLRAPVRPGGWVAVCDTDFTTIELSPAPPAWRRAWSAFCDATIATGWDIRCGARLPGELEAIELDEIRTESVTRRVPGGSAWSRLFAATLQRLRERLLAVGADEADLEESQRLLADPSAAFVHATTWLAWGRRPAS